MIEVVLENFNSSNIVVARKCNKTLEKCSVIRIPT